MGGDNSQPLGKRKMRVWNSRNKPPIASLWIQWSQGTQETTRETGSGSVAGAVGKSRFFYTSYRFYPTSYSQCLRGPIRDPDRAINRIK